MAAFNGRAFLLGIQHLDASNRELFDQHGKRMDGRFRLVEHLVEDSMVRLAGGELEEDMFGPDRHR